jgi:molybdopterin/thiamine biosynthesis adenylyltransferase
MDLSDEQIERYARHIVLREVGGAGQRKLLAARVLVIGAGGLGSPLIMYLAAAGVGTIGVVDDDQVSLSNLQRQVLHGTDGVGDPKTASAAGAVAALNPDVRVVEHPVRFAPDNALDLVSGYDLVADGSDNFRTRYLANDACFFARKPLVTAAVDRFDGQLMTLRAFEVDKPCYRCLFEAPPPEEMQPSCARDGILGALAGVMGTLQAVEVLKELLGIGETLAGSLLLYDSLDTTCQRLRVRPDPACPLCGESPTIRTPGPTPEQP